MRFFVCLMIGCLVLGSYSIFAEEGEDKWTYSAGVRIWNAEWKLEADSLNVPLDLNPSDKI
ncbi:MAG: hypothetical protein GKR87_04035 [Kiritimatiellae bacterium]|nr:hypothetical protein [Kiritimatiellia bacterium]